MTFPSLTRMVAVAAVFVSSLFAEEAPKKIGIIGLDTSHVVAFTTVFNKGPKNPADAAKYAGFRVTHAFAQGSKDIPESTTRVPEYTEKLKGMGVEIVDSIEKLCAQVDFVMLESNDGRVHLEQVLPVLKAGKTVFIDKPIAGSLADVIRIQEAAKQAGVVYFCSSSLRFAASTQAVAQGSVGKVKTAYTTSPASLEPHHPDLYWYGVHGCESLYTVMGTGCLSVKRDKTPEGFIQVTGNWGDGRVGTYREADRKAKGGPYGGKAIGEKGEAEVGKFDGYEVLLQAVVKMFRTGKAQVSAEETLELYAFMEAADESKRQGGAEVKLADVLAKARAEVAKGK
ncbi:MAG: Gfo/Idh/MocA family protein [Opitutales bacterium]|jgi:predicted dehydrogenase